jgi:hypothetical protein
MAHDLLAGFVGKGFGKLQLVNVHKFNYIDNHQYVKALIVSPARSAPIDSACISLLQNRASALTSRYNHCRWRNFDVEIST